MKTFEEIIKQESVFLHNWSNVIDVLKDFDDIFDPSDTDKQELLNNHRGERILFASYGTDNYSGDAFVLFEKDGKLYEVNGSHCSCYGLEEQWKPEEVMLSELENRLLNGTFGEDDYSGNEFKKELCEFLGVEFKLNQIYY